MVEKLVKNSNYALIILTCKPEADGVTHDWQTENPNPSPTPPPPMARLSSPVRMTPPIHSTLVLQAWERKPALHPSDRKQKGGTRPPRGKKKSSSSQKRGRGRRSVDPPSR
ncbi:hypothetical protein CDAR_76861 [Caerostris darwini]|uniref:Uncharacterized protein n=1 Tax=Caerostris darwini TaxID=1538125 RepID=A0AAV4QC34_9ARAC|nr:hypothetical protein CDAR_76861 [Caerostris darwini]